MADFVKIEKKWQKKWKTSKVFVSKEGSNKKKFYNLEMFPYPSGVGLHVGHSRNFSIGDCIARFKRMRGYNVLYPMGWDSFGLPSENAAIAKGVHPTASIKQNIKTMKTQMEALGLSYDWSRELATHDANYYKWDQWLFLKLFEKGLAYKKNALGNWCPSCKTTLANEDVKDGLCWRCDSQVAQKEIEQWFVKVTDYIDDLLKGLDKIDWSERLKTMQRNWIGKSQGITEVWDVEDTNFKLETFTTWPHTTLGVTFMVIAPEHPNVDKLIKGTKYEKSGKKFVEKIMKQRLKSREIKDKEGFFTGKYAINYATGIKMPIYIANFAIMGYGTGIVKGCPAHDKRDFEFAKKYGLKIIPVIQPEGKMFSSKLNEPYIGDGTMINAKQFTGMSSTKAKEEFTKWAIKQKRAKRTTAHKIRDWNISRQRYWGAPIPIIYCDECGIVPVPEKDLPVKLPLKIEFGKGGTPPLATNVKFVNVKCPKCKGPGRRETDTMTTFVDSAWYFLRYCDPSNNKEIFKKSSVKYWMPVDQYTGGIEHAVGHLLYSRFIVKFLKKIGYVDFDEPFTKLLNQGMVNLGGSKMSKSKGNVIDPVKIIKKFGADTLRTYILFVAQPDTSFEWSDKDIKGIFKTLQKIPIIVKSKETKDKKYIESITQSKIKEITNYLENLQFNRALIEIFDFQNKIEKYPSKYSINVFLRLLAPFAPHICEEAWEKLGEKKMICQANWPKVEKSKIDLKAEQLKESLIRAHSDINNILNITKKKPKIIYLYVVPPDLANFKSVEKNFSVDFGSKVQVFASNDSNKIDPEGKAKKAKPGKPGIYIE